MIKKVVWVVLSVSILLSIIFTTGFITSLNIIRSGEKEIMELPKMQTNDKENSTENLTNSNLKILIMGDSIGYGIGDEENLGIGKRYQDLMNTENQTKLEITNISVPGYESDDLGVLIKSQENQSIIAEADLIIISIGGNDLNRLKYTDELTMSISFKETVKKYKENIETIINEIRTVNTDSQLAFIGLYDPFDKKEPQKTKFLLEWNYETRLIIDTDLKSSYIPTYEEFEYHLDEFLSADRFHPSAEGYQIIAEALYRILN